jgi:sugar phosphate isomerase/epimerase
MKERFRGYGYALIDRGSPAHLDELLRAVADAGYDYAEVDPRHWNVWLGGRANASELGRWAAVLDRHRDRLRYTLHGPLELNLFETAERGLHERLLRTGVEVARAVGAELTVYHPGWRPTPSVDRMADLVARERETLRGLATELETWGGQLAVETWFSVGAVGYSYAVWPEQLAGQVEAIDHAAVGVCLDFSHLFLASGWFGFDFLEGVRRLAPLASHLHVQDTFAVSADVNIPTLGKGDLHLPPGWGAIPLADAFAAGDFARRPVLMVELLDERFLDRLETWLAGARELAATVPGSSPAS